MKEVLPTNECIIFVLSYNTFSRYDAGNQEDKG